MNKKKIQAIINLLLGILFIFQGIYNISYEGKISFWPGLLIVFGILELVFAFLKYKDGLK
ncbi:hypothetical protein [Anaerococcus provencensis]|uniref:hypothetical protein n=1 Tax=Anaerococcus provencensis TaxID=938293 RepID=UPI00031EA5AF|nr:hypothetical protein [Anaerococcus provencensis]